MKSVSFDRKLISNYVRLLKNLSPKMQREIISGLKRNGRKSKVKSMRSTADAFGSWVGNETAEEIINDIRDNRTVITRTIEEF